MEPTNQTLFFLLKLNKSKCVDKTTVLTLHIYSLWWRGHRPSHVGLAEKPGPEEEPWPARQPTPALQPSCWRSPTAWTFGHRGTEMAQMTLNPSRCPWLIPKCVPILLGSRNSRKWNTQPLVLSRPVRERGHQQAMAAQCQYHAVPMHAGIRARKASWRK